jgi:hypothetical protein
LQEAKQDSSVLQGGVGFSDLGSNGGTAIIGSVKNSEIIFSVEESREGGYEAHALGYPIFTEADSIPELKEMVRDAVRCHFDTAAIPSVIRLHFVRDEVISA